MNIFFLLRGRVVAKACRSTARASLVRPKTRGSRRFTRTRTFRKRRLALENSNRRTHATRAITSDCAISSCREIMLRNIAILWIYPKDIVNPVGLPNHRAACMAISATAALRLAPVPGGNMLRSQRVMVCSSWQYARVGQNPRFPD